LKRAKHNLKDFHDGGLNCRRVSLDILNRVTDRYIVTTRVA
jgi:uncharacterized protein (DUF885 family)